MTPHPNFRINQTRTPKGWTRLSLEGELDISVARDLHDRIWELSDAGAPVELDLSGLTFLDSTGISVLVVAVRGARESGRQLEIPETITPAVRRALESSGVEGLLWPPEQLQDDG